jgi:site-specific recombinase XerD
VRDLESLGPWVRRFLLEYLVGERNFATNTQRSYRDTLCLLIPFVAATTKTTVDRLTIGHATPEITRRFLTHLETTRHCGVATRNQRLAAIHSLARYIGERSPEHLAWCSEICRIAFKKAVRETVCYLEKPEMDALLDAPDRTTPQGFRDYAVLLFLYNSGARATEVATLTVGDLDLPDTHPASVRLLGKGSKVRRCPLWTSTATVLKTVGAGRPTTAHVFVNRRTQPLTRFGVHDLVVRHARHAASRMPSLQRKRVSPHTIRHTTATHLLRSGVDINTIRAWLGHVSIETTNIYAEIDLATKARALATCAVQSDNSRPPIWNTNKDLLVFLRSL